MEESRFSLISYETILPSQVEWRQLSQHERICWTHLASVLSWLTSVKNGKKLAPIDQEDLALDLNWIRSDAAPSSKTDIYTFNAVCESVGLDPHRTRKQFLWYWEHGEARKPAVSDEQVKEDILTLVAKRPGVGMETLGHDVRGGYGRVKRVLGELITEGAVSQTKGPNNVKQAYLTHQNNAA